MIELILEIPMELKVIIGSGIIMGLFNIEKIRYGKNNNKKIHK